jgi:hypothetical protein
MGTVNTSETSASLYQTARLNIPEDSHLHTRSRQNFKSHKIILKSTEITVCERNVCNCTVLSERFQSSTQSKLPVHTWDSNRNRKNYIIKGNKRSHKERKIYKQI